MTPLDHDDQDGTFVALDIGGGHLKGALVADDGTVVRADRRPTPDAGNDSLHAVLGLVEGLQRHATDLGAPVRAAGIAVSGIVDDSTGTIVFSANLGWRDVALRPLAEARLGIPTAVVQDARSGALAEATLGAGRGVDNFLYVPIGTGVGGAVVLRGEPIGGATHAAGELGHVRAVPDGRPCACGSAGCVEAYLGGAAMAEHYRERTGVPRTAAEIAGRLGSDADADAIWGQGVRALAHAVAPLIAGIDPALVVLGGGVANAGAHLTEPLHDALQAHLGYRRPPRLTIGHLGEDAARTGAFVAARRAVS